MITQLLIVTGVAIITQPTSVVITVNANVTLNCVGTGRGFITYQWETSDINGVQWMNISNSNTTRLFVGNLEQSQQYRCIALNEDNSTMSDNATVFVLSKLFISPCTS